MSNTPSTGKNPLWTWLKVCLALDVAWAIVVAVLYSSGIHILSGVAGAGSTATGVVTTAGAIFAFVIGFIQGGVFLFVISMFIFVGILLFGGKSNSRNNGGTGF